MDGLVNGWMYEWMYRLMDGWTDRLLSEYLTVPQFLLSAIE